MSPISPNMWHCPGYGGSPYLLPHTLLRLHCTAQCIVVVLQPNVQKIICKTILWEIVYWIYRTPNITIFQEQLINRLIYIMTAIWDNQDNTAGQGGESCTGNCGLTGSSVLGGLETRKHPHPEPGRKHKPHVSVCIVNLRARIY